MDDRSVDRAEVFDERIARPGGIILQCDATPCFRIVHSEIDLREYSCVRVCATYQHALFVDHERLDHVRGADDDKLRGDAPAALVPAPL